LKATALIICLYFNHVIILFSLAVLASSQHVCVLPSTCAFYPALSEDSFYFEIEETFLTQH